MLGEGVCAHQLTPAASEGGFGGSWGSGLPVGTPLAWPRGGVAASAATGVAGVGRGLPW